MDSTAGLGIAGLEDGEVAGQGGFAVVYKAEQPAFRRTVAVKVLSTQLDEATHQRFDRECQVMGSLSEHPSIVTIFDAGTISDGRPYLLMAFMPGGSLGDVIKNGPMHWEDAVAIGVRMAGALEVAHQRDVIHRDVKPDNILLSSFGEPQLSDFGIARIAGGHETRSGIISASLAYAPPEVIDGDRPSVATDVYSLGSTLYTLLAGAPAFTKPTDEGMYPILQRIHADPVPDLRTRGVPSLVADAVEAAMQKDPANRPQSALEFGQLLRDAQAQLGIAPTSMLLGFDADGRRSDSDEARGEARDTVVMGASPTQPPADLTSPTKPIVTTPERSSRRRTITLLVAVAALLGIAAAVFALSRGDTTGSGSAEVQTIAPGQEIPVTLSDMEGDVQTFTFEGQAGVVASVELIAESVGADPMVTIFGPDNEQIAGDDDLGGGVDDIDALSIFVMSEDDFYEIDAIDRSESGTEMTLVLTFGSVPLIDLPVEVEGALSFDEFDREVYVFEAEAGQVLDIRMSAVLPGLDPWLLVLGPMDQIADDDDSGGGLEGFDARVEFTAPVTGPYRISAEHSDSTGGPYRLTVDVAEAGE